MERRANGTKVRKRANGYGTLERRGGIYFARWTEKNAEDKVVRHSKSLKTGDRREAEKMLTNLRMESITKNEVERLKKDYEAANLKLAEFEALKITDAFRVWRSRHHITSQNTLYMYECQFRVFEKWIHDKHSKVVELRAVTRDMAQEFADEKLDGKAPGDKKEEASGDKKEEAPGDKKGKASGDKKRKVSGNKKGKASGDKKRKVSGNTYNKYITLFRKIWKDLEEDARLTCNPWEKIEKSPVNPHTRRELTIEELGRVIASIDDGDYRLLFAIGIYTGLRLRDCALLDWGNVDIVRGFISIIPHKTERHANGRPTLIPLFPDLTKLFLEIPENNRHGYVIPEIAEKYNHDRSLVSNKIQRIFQGAGITTNGERGKDRHSAPVDVGFHSLRHTYVSLCANKGVPMAIVQAIVGHSNPAMTRHYFHASEDALKSVLEVLPSIDLSGNTQNLPVDVPSEIVTANVPPEAPERIEGRFSAFCEIVDGMSAGELKRAADYIQKRLAMVTK